MARSSSTALLSVHCTTASTGSHGPDVPLIAGGCCVGGASCLDLPVAGLAGPPSGGRHVWCSDLCSLAACAAWKDGVTTGVPAARRPSEAWCTPSWPETKPWQQHLQGTLHICQAGGGGRGDLTG
jgi:hypothetical protein